MVSTIRWKVTFQVYRKKGSAPAHFDAFEMEVDPDEYVLDGVERIWAHKDRTLVYRHACHHSTCGACGMRVNGVEKLTCITPIRDVTHDGGTLRVEPLRNFPILSDLAVDMTPFYARMDQARYPAVAPVSATPSRTGIQPQGEGVTAGFTRLNDCIECGLCISACPIATTAGDYHGPGVMAGIQFSGLKGHPDLVDLADRDQGVWRCHSVYECSEVCPSFVDPAARIMDLRAQVIRERIHQLFHPREG
jgi:succinate dehydrogenase/fumarate reductase iron-sulfur protein